MEPERELKKGDWVSYFDRPKPGRVVSFYRSHFGHWEYGIDFGGHRAEYLPFSCLTLTDPLHAALLNSNQKPKDQK